MAKTKSKRKRDSSASSDSSSSSESEANKKMEKSKTKDGKEYQKSSNKKYKKNREKPSSSESDSSKSESGSNSSSESGDSSRLQKRNMNKSNKNRKDEAKRRKSAQEVHHESAEEHAAEDRKRDSGTAAHTSSSGNNRSKWDSPVRSHEDYNRYNRGRPRDSGSRNQNDNSRGGRGRGAEDGDGSYRNRYERNNDHRRKVPERQTTTSGSRDNRLWNDRERNNDRDRYRDDCNDQRQRNFPRNDYDRNRRDDRRDRSRSYSRSPDNRQQQRRHRRRKSDDNSQDYEWGKRDAGDKRYNKDDKGDNRKQPVEKEKPNFGLSGKLLEDTNMVNGVVVKYSEPIEARKPKRRWRLYPFKGETALPTLHIHRQSCFLVGRDRKVCDLAVDHPSCSKQHAALQYRLVPFEREDGTTGKRVRPYIIDLESANGTFLNNQKITAKKYYELIEKDVIKFGFSSREYVVLHENSKEDKEDDDVKQEEDDDDGQLPPMKAIKTEAKEEFKTEPK